MTDKELRRLSRANLLEMLSAQMEENERLKAELEQTKEALADRNLEMEQSGSLAEAALRLNGVFRAADEAAQQYLSSIQRMNSQQESRLQQIEAEAQQRATAVKQEADAYSRDVHAKADAYWEQVQQKVRELLWAQNNLQSFLQNGMGAIDV